VDNGVFPDLNGLPLSQTKGLLDEVIDDGLIAVFAECGLRAFFQACLDDALLDLDEDDEAGEGTLATEDCMRGGKSLSSMVLWMS